MRNLTGEKTPESVDHNEVSDARETNLIGQNVYKEVPTTG